MTRFLPVLLALVLAPACVFVDEGSELTVVNDSSYDFHELRLAPIDSDIWGPNELDRTLYAGDSITLGGIVCGTYDLLVVDDLGDDCVLYDFSLCLNDSDITYVDNRDLLDCSFRR